MKRRTALCIVTAFSLCLAFPLFGADTLEASKKKAVDLVNKGLAHIKKAGEKQAFADFTDKNGGFVSGDYYLFVVDFNGLTLAHGGNPALVGKSLLELKDADGKFFIKEFIKATKSEGSAWVDYKWSNPTTKKVEPKSTYVKRMQGADYFLGCGIYLQ
jgi:cytochrome c